MLKKFFATIICTILLLTAFLLFSSKESRAATNGSFRLVSTSTNLTQQCNYRVDIMVNTGGDNSNAADIEIHYDPSRIEIIDSKPAIPGVQILDGTAYEAYFGNTVDATTGVIRLAGASFSNNLNGEGLFATIEFKSRSSVASANFTITFAGVGNTLDSNISETSTSLDILGSVQNLSFTFTPGTCTADTVGPIITFTQPTSNISYPPNGHVFITISDNQSGVDINTVTIVINGVTYYPTDPEVTVSGTAASYSFEIVPRSPFPTDSASIIIVNAQDLAGNNSSAAITFNNPVLPTPSPTTLPETGEECLIPVPPVGESIIRTINSITTLTNTIIDSLPLPAAIKDIIKEAGLPSFSALLALLTMIAYGVITLLALRSPRDMFYLIGFLFSKRRKEPWGVIIDKSTNKPIAFANVRLYLSGTKSLVTEKVSDLDGRYGFIASAGQYRLEVEHSDYVKEVVDISVPETGAINKDLYLTPLTAKHNIFAVLKNLMSKFRKAVTPYLIYIYVIGFFSSIIATVFNPILFNIIVTLLYFILFILSLIIRKLRIKNWGSIYDSSSNLLVPNALVKLFDLKNWKLMDTQMTDSHGRFGLFVEPGEYGLLTTAQGYNFPSKKQTDLPVLQEKYQSLLKFDIRQGKKLDVDIYLDPYGEKGAKSASEKFESAKKQGAKQTQSSPFGQN